MGARLEWAEDKGVRVDRRQRHDVLKGSTRQLPEEIAMTFEAEFRGLRSISEV